MPTIGASGTEKLESGLHKDLPLPGNAEPLTAADPRTIGAYTIIGRLGAGGMGSVYLGRGPDGAPVAVKVIRDELGADPGFRARFEQEVAAGLRVASFCTAAMLGHGTHEGRPYLVTEFIEGPTLLAHVLANGALSAGTLQGFAVGVATALTAIHGAGLVHRDLKPSNVILSVSGPRVIDFGIARALDSSTGVTRTGQLIGSPGWIAPEQLLADRATTAVDVYTWGCLVAFAARARHPFGSGEPIALASRVLHGEPELDGIPEPLLGLVRAAMSKDPALRPTAQQLLITLVGGGSPQALNDQATRMVEQNWQAPPPGPSPDTLPPGTPGTPGPPGVPGAQGFQSPQGPAGQGLQGPQDPAGQGGPGAQGLQSPQGPASQGVPGAQGFQSPQGLAGQGGPGAQGLQSPQGPAGQSGPGAQGFQSPQGPAGQSGPAGQGFQSPQGPASQGVPGAQGFQSPQGPAGQGGPGAQGFQSPAGPGAQGFQSPQGPTPQGGELGAQQTWPPRYPPGGQQPGVVPTAPQPEPKGGRRVVYALSGVLAALVAATVLVFVFKEFEGDRGDSGSGGPSRPDTVNSLEAQGFKPVDLSDDTDIGRGISDAGVEFTVGQPRCGGTVYRGVTAQNGAELCLVPLTISNRSLQSKSERVFRNRQVLVTENGDTISTTEVVDGFLNNAPSIPPGGQISGELLFEVPDGADPVAIRLHGSDTSQGIEVKR